MAYLKPDKMQWIASGPWKNSEQWRITITDIYGTAHRFILAEAWQSHWGQMYVSCQVVDHMHQRRDGVVLVYDCFSKISLDGKCTETGAEKIWVPDSQVLRMTQAPNMTKVKKPKQATLPF